MKLTFQARTFSALRTFATRTFAGGTPAVFYHAVRIGETTEVTVTTSLANVCWYCWYVDGAFVGKTTGPRKSFHVPAGEQFRLEVIPTANADFDPIANAPLGFPTRRTLWWTRGLDADTAKYRIEQREGEGDWTSIAEIPQKTNGWDFSTTTGRLADLTEYTWRIVPVDVAGNDGTPVTIGPELIVRTPDAPNFTIEYQPETETVLFEEVVSG